MKRRTRLLFLAIDVLSMVAALFIAFWLRFESFTQHTHYEMGVRMLVFSIPVTVIILWWVGLYNRTIAFTSIPDLIAVFQAATLATMAKMGFIYFQWLGFSRAILLADWLLTMAFIGLARLAPRLLLLLAEEPWVRWAMPGALGGGEGKRVLIFGAGRAGESVVRELRQGETLGITPVGFIDDDRAKQGQFIHGVQVLGTRRDLAQLAERYEVEEIIIALSAASGQTVREIARDCRAAGLRVKTVPGLTDMLAGRQARLQVRDIDISDLLRRPPVRLDLESIAAYVKGKRVLVTGAGGSIGSELCRQLLPFGPGALFLLGQGENSIYQIHQDLLQRPEAAGVPLVPVIANVQDGERLRQVFAERRPQIVFHAAAHKHVPLMEDHPCEAVKNNVLGTRNLLRAGRDHPPERFVMISTDKAVKPTSVMGATKRVAEMLLQIEARRSGPALLQRVSDRGGAEPLASPASKANGSDPPSPERMGIGPETTDGIASPATRYAAVRFGNVLGSRGSVIPLFMKQIERGEAITITHPDMVRYFMTIPEASQLVIQAGALGTGGEIFLLDMGEPVRVLDLAEDLIRLAGFEPGKDVRIEFSGTRPGEKLHEELLTAVEETSATRIEKIYVARSEAPDEAVVTAAVDRLIEVAARGDGEAVVAGLRRLVPTFVRAADETPAVVGAGEGVKGTIP